MSSNKIINSRIVGSIRARANPVVAKFLEAVAKNPNPLPEGTAELVLRQRDLSSENDNKKHFTAVCLNEKGEYMETIHVPKEG